MKKIKISSFALVAALMTTVALLGCGGGGGSSSTSTGGTGDTNNPSGDLAPSSVAGKTVNGRIGTTSTVWQIVFSTSGTYSYSENGKPLDSGNFTYTKTSSNTSVVTLADGTSIQLTYNSQNSGTYMIAQNPPETGTFTSN